MSEELEKLARRIREIEKRNLHVQAEKAWETSWFRVGTIAVLTYVVAVLFMNSIGVDKAALSSFIPTGGYVLSTLSIPWIKRWWISRGL